MILNSQKNKKNEVVTATVICIHVNGQTIHERALRGVMTTTQRRAGRRRVEEKI